MCCWHQQFWYIIFVGILMVYWWYIDGKWFIFAEFRRFSSFNTNGSQNNIRKFYRKYSQILHSKWYSHGSYLKISRGTPLPNSRVSITPPPPPPPHGRIVGYHHGATCYYTTDPGVAARRGVTPPLHEHPKSFSHPGKIKRSFTYSIHARSQKVNDDQNYPGVRRPEAPGEKPTWSNDYVRLRAPSGLVRWVKAI